MSSQTAVECVLNIFIRSTAQAQDRPEGISVRPVCGRLNDGTEYIISGVAVAGLMVQWPFRGKRVLLEILSPKNGTPKRRERKNKSETTSHPNAPGFIV